MRDQIFISYSHKDTKWLNMLRTMLQPLVREKKITVWDDKQIRPGSKWREEINKALDSAKVAVLLVSPDFLASDFISKHELPPLLQAAESSGTIIFWIAVRPSMYKDTVLEHYQSANNPSKPLSSLKPHVRETELVNICIQIKAAAASAKTGHDVPENIQRLKAEYFNSLKVAYEYMDLGGISPRVGNKVVRIRMNDLFVPLKATAGAPLFEYYSEELTEESSDATEQLDVIDATSDEFDVSGFDVRGSSDQEGTHSVSREKYISTRPIEVAEMLQKPRIVVLGDPGSGKTTVGRYIAYSLANESIALGLTLTHLVPIIIKAADYAQHIKENSDIAFYDYLTQKSTTKYNELFKWVLQSGTCLVIIDGLDEVPEPTLRITTSSRIDKFVSEFNRNRFLVTSRIVGYRQNQLTGNFDHFTLSELSEGQIQRFLKQWHKAIENESESQVSEAEVEGKADDLWHAIKANQSIRKLASNPLLLTIIALANWRGTKLPNRRVELYQIATETLIENWPLKQRGLAIDADEILAILEPIAFHILNSSPNNLISEHLLRPLFEKQVCEVRGTTVTEAKALSREILQTIEEHTGFFLLKGLDQRNQNVYGFLHLTFAEYLSARFLAEQWSGGNLDLQQYTHEPRWHEVMLLMAGHIGTWATTQSTSLVKDILNLNSKCEVYLHRDLLLAAEVLSDNVRIKRDLQDLIVSRLINIALDTPYTPLLRSILYRLRDIAKFFQLGFPVTDLQVLNGNKEQRLRKALILTAVGRETDETHKILFNALMQHRDGDGFFEEIGILHLWSLFANLTQGGNHVFTIGSPSTGTTFYRVSAEVTAKFSNSKLKFFNLDTLFLGSKNIDNKSKQIWIINSEDPRLRSPELVDVLLECSDNILLIVGQALSLGGIPLTIIFDQLLQRAIHETSPKLQLKAIETFKLLYSNVGGRRHKVSQHWSQQLKTLFHSNNDSRIRAEALIILHYMQRQVGDQSWQGILHEALDDPNEEVRHRAIRIVANYNSKPPTAILNKITKLRMDVSPNIRNSTAELIIELEKTADSEIISLLQDRYNEAFKPQQDYNFKWLEHLVKLAKKARSRNTRSAVTEQLVSIIENDDIDINESLLFESLDFFYPSRGSKSVNLTKVARSLFSSPRASTRRRALGVWNYIRPEMEPLEQIIPLLNDDDFKVKATTIKILGTAESMRGDVIHILLQSLTDEHEEVSEAAASALNKINNPASRKLITEHITDLITYHPQNMNIYDVLWNLLGDSAADVDDIPF